MWIACDEAGHTGPDLLAKDQRYFAFASVNISDDEAWELISEARQAHPVQMPELKASKLMGSNRGRRLVSHIIEQLDGRFALSWYDKLLALCGWVFEYIFEPVYQNDPRIFYQKDYHKFIAMYCYFWFQDERSEAKATLAQFQAFMRSKDIRDAPALFEFNAPSATGQPHPFELIQRFATGHKDIIAKDVAEIEKHTSDKGTWTLDLSTSGLWSHLNYWGKRKEPLTVTCDDSKPLRATVGFLCGDRNSAANQYADYLHGAQGLGWKFERPLQFVDSRAHPSVQLADILASTAVYCLSKGLPEGMEKTREIMDRGMLPDCISPDYEKIKLENNNVKVNYTVLLELAAIAEGRGTGYPIEVFYEIVEKGVASG